MELLHQPDLFWMDKTSCAEVGLRLQGPVTFTAPEPRVTTTSIPGRNGDLCFFDGSYSNVSGTAKCFALAPDRVDRVLSAIAGWTLSAPGYHRLIVSNEPDYYRMARVVSGPATEIRMRRLAPFELDFDCKPQKFLRNGGEAISYAAPGTLYNPFRFPAEPLVKVSGNGSGALKIGPYTVNILSLDGYLVLDSQTQNAYKGTANKNASIRAAEFPRLVPGVNEVTWSGGVTSVEITPHWWTL